VNSRAATQVVALCAVAAVAVAALVAVAMVVAALRAPGPGVDRPGPPPGAALDATDRRALGAVPVRRGPPAASADSRVDLTDPAAVARAYLAAARSSEPADRSRTRLRAAGYAEPGSPPAAVGVVVIDAPAAGQVRTAAVTALDVVTTDAADLRRAYRAVVITATGPPGGPATTTATTAQVVLARQPDGRWLVAADTPDLTEGDD
jgi:hypothetical protein